MESLSRRARLLQSVSLLPLFAALALVALQPLTTLQSVVALVAGGLAIYMIAPLSKRGAAEELPAWLIEEIEEERRLYR